MKLISTAIILSIVLIACKSIVSISNNEDKGIKEVLDFYGGYCKYSIGASASTEDGTKKYFELELSKSDIIEKIF